MFKNKLRKSNIKNKN